MFSGKKIGVYFFDTFANAKKILEQKFSKRPSLDEIQVVIKQEGNMEDPELQKYGRVYAGAAWYIIHERRVADGLVTKIETDE